MLQVCSLIQYISNLRFTYLFLSLYIIEFLKFLKFFENSDLNRSLCVCVWREFAFAMKAQLEICRSLGWTRSRKTQNETVATNRSKKLKKSDPKDPENDELMDQKVKDLGDLGDSMSEEEAKSNVVDLTSGDESKGHVGESESAGEGGSKKDRLMPVFDEELKGGVIEILQDHVKEEKIEGVSIMFFFFNQILFLLVVYAIPSSLFHTVAFPIQIIFTSIA